MLCRAGRLIRAARPSRGRVVITPTQSAKRKSKITLERTHESLQPLLIQRALAEHVAGDHHVARARVQPRFGVLSRHAAANLAAPGAR